MPVSPTNTLATIAANSKLRVHERITQIKGEDKRISSPEEAKAILAIPYHEISWLENKNELPLAQLEAKNYLKYGDSNWQDVMIKVGKYLKRKGIQALERFSNYLISDTNSVAQNTK